MEQSYTNKSIEVLDDLEHIRKRPGMYIGSIDSDGVYQIFKEVLDNSLDEYLANHASRIYVNIQQDQILVRDNGRGIPVEIHEKTGISTLTTVLTNLQAGGKFGKQSYAVSSGLHGVGLKATNALSSKLQVVVWRSGKCYFQNFQAGLYTEPHARNPARDKELEHGTEISFTPDTSIFGSNTLDQSRVKSTLEEIVYLCPGLAIELVLDKQITSYQAKGGLIRMVNDMASKETPLEEALEITNKKTIHIALMWTESAEEEFHKSYCNLSPTPEHGAHSKGLQRALTKVLGEYSKDVLPADLRAGMFSAIHVKVGEPIFKGQTKSKLQNSEVESEVFELVFPVLQAYFLKRKALAKIIADKASKLLKAREQFKKLKNSLKDVFVANKTAKGLLPGKLVEAPHCRPEERELFLVEGDSAAGGAVGARDPRYQEILALKGKILNSQRAEVAQVLKSEEIQSIILATGIIVDPTRKSTENDLSNLRIGKIMILTDADSDGYHISALILSFILNYMWTLVVQERVYVVRSPLFRATNSTGKQFWYGDSIVEIEKKSGINSEKLQISRLKGHGEASAADLKTYAMDPASRKLIKLKYSKEQFELFSTYMGSDSDVRKAILGIA